MNESFQSLKLNILYIHIISFEIVCEEVCDTGNVFDDGQIIMAILSIEEVKEMSKRPSEVVQLEDRVKAWIRRVAEVLKESEQIRKENDSSGNIMFNIN